MTREQQRLSHRRRVAEAARELTKHPSCRPYDWSGACARCYFGEAFDAALAAPKPWVTGSQRLQPVRTTRARRKHCNRLLRRQLEGAGL